MTQVSEKADLDMLPPGLAAASGYVAGFLSELPETEERKLRISVQRMSGEEDILEVPEDATVQVLREAIERSTSMNFGRSAYRLIHSSVCLNNPHAKLQDLEIKDLSIVTIMKERSRDYTRVEDAKVMKCQQYPNGLVFYQGRLLVAHYFGELQVYDSDFNLLHTSKLPSTGSPAQICIAGDGCLVIAHRDSCVAVLEPKKDGESDESMEDAEGALQWQPNFSLKSTIKCAPQGVAVSGDLVFVTTRSGYLSTFRLSDGQRVDHRKGGSEWDLLNPQGLCVIEDKVLAVADRGADRVLILEIESMKCIGQLPPYEVWPGPGTRAARLKKRALEPEMPETEMLLKYPNDVALDAAGNLLVMDTKNERVAVFRQDGSFVASVMKGTFKAYGSTFSYVACNHETGAIAISNNDKHEIAIVTPP